MASLKHLLVPPDPYCSFKRTEIELQNMFQPFLTHSLTLTHSLFHSLALSSTLTFFLSLSILTHSLQQSLTHFIPHAWPLPFPRPPASLTPVTRGSVRTSVPAAATTLLAANANATASRSQAEAQNRAPGPGDCWTHITTRTNSCIPAPNCYRTSYPILSLVLPTSYINSMYVCLFIYLYIYIYILHISYTKQTQCASHKNRSYDPIKQGFRGLKRCMKDI